LVALKKVIAEKFKNPKDALSCGVSVASTIGSMISAGMVVLDPSVHKMPGLDWMHFAAIYGLSLIASLATLQVIAQFLPGLVTEITRRIRRRYPLVMAMIGCFAGFLGGIAVFFTARFLAPSHHHWDDPELWKFFSQFAFIGASYGSLMALGTSLYIEWQKTHSSSLNRDDKV